MSEIEKRSSAGKRICDYLSDMLPTAFASGKTISAWLPTKIFDFEPECSPAERMRKKRGKGKKEGKKGIWRKRKREKKRIFC